jgi:hypothetical protein
MGHLNFRRGPERETWLRGCSADPVIVAEVRRLLNCDERLGERVPAAREQLPRF